MKKIGVLLMFVSLMACKNVDQYKAGIGELATNWDSATSEITGFAKIVEGANANITAAVAATDAKPATPVKIKPEDQAKIDAAKNDLKTAGSNLGNILSEVTNFITDWSAKGAEVTALKDGLAAGKLEGDVPGKIAELSKYITDGTTKLASWKEAFSAAQTSSNAAQTALEAAMKMVAPAAAPAKK